MNKESETEEIKNLYLELRQSTVMICDRQSNDLVIVFLVQFCSYVCRSLSQKQSFSGMEESPGSLHIWRKKSHANTGLLNYNFQMLHFKMYILSVYE